MGFSEETIENCNHRFVVATKYVSTCRICGEKRYRYENFGVKITLGLFGFEPDDWKDEVDTINYLHDNLRLSFAKWCLFVEKQFDNFESFSDEKLIEMYEEQNLESLNKRLRK